VWQHLQELEQEDGLLRNHTSGRLQDIVKGSPFAQNDSLFHLTRPFELLDFAPFQAQSNRIELEA
jgi:hypothetical protein